MRLLIILLAGLLLATTVWSRAAEAAELGCDGMPAAMSMHVPGDCDQVPADADKGYPHCHTGCHGQTATAPVSIPVSVRTDPVERAYVSPEPMAIAVYDADRTLRPPIA